MGTAGPKWKLLLAGVLVTMAACVQSGNGVLTAASPIPVAVQGIAPTEIFAVGYRTMPLRRGDHRSLPTTIWYPAVGPPGSTSAQAAAAEGRYPMVLFSHGLGGTPEGFTALAGSLAAAGFVVMAPAYPHTKKGAPGFDRNDVRNQPADAAYVIAQVSQLDTREGDLLAGHLAVSRICAAGHSAGGFTTSGMFTTASRSPALRCAVIISAGAMDGGFTGNPVPVLFVHGDADEVVAYHRGRAAYDRLTWPKVFLTVHRQGHGEFLDPHRSGYPQVQSTIVDFLRWNLYGDTNARDRLPVDGAAPPTTTLELRL